MKVITDVEGLKKAFYAHDKEDPLASYYHGEMMREIDDFTVEMPDVVKREDVGELVDALYAFRSRGEVKAAKAQAMALPSWRGKE